MGERPAEAGEFVQVRDRVHERMEAEGIPVGTDDPTLLALGARPLGVPNLNLLTDEEYEALYGSSGGSNG